MVKVEHLISKRTHKQNTEIIAKAVDSAGNVQPEKVEDIWNLRGILNTSWHRIQLQVTDSYP
ncbi:Mo-co oxidoreductase dimerization domain protein [Medicago truncatula]|uniref:Mo-co oxidoreductase dimerization domain protein n=1 Tax=Medicago truncatula TaxID=3880 RepID=A0A072TF56_MEDTR|nr:Mo-co oxidoreductase dimerization domain protein [Medicago truncatula]